MSDLQLIEIVEKSGLEKVEQKTITEKFSDYESVAKEWEKKQNKLLLLMNLN